MYIYTVHYSRRVWRIIHSRPTSLSSVRFKSFQLLSFSAATSCIVGSGTLQGCVTDLSPQVDARIEKKKNPLLQDETGSRVNPDYINKQVKALLNSRTATTATILSDTG